MLFYFCKKRNSNENMLATSNVEMTPIQSNNNLQVSNNLTNNISINNELNLEPAVNEKQSVNLNF